MELSRNRNWLKVVLVGVVLLLIANVFLFINKQQKGESYLINSANLSREESKQALADLSVTEANNSETIVTDDVITQADMVLKNVNVKTEEEKIVTDSGQREEVVLAGGCFWCSEAYLQETEGVVEVISGYAGGKSDTADYKTVSSGNTDHREAVQVTFDPVRISLEEVLDVYWSHIDPTDAGGQFADRGTQYITAIFYLNDTQKMIAEDSKKRLEESGLFTEPIATEILPFTTFFPAEEYHQDYYLKAADHYNRYKKASGRAGFVEDNWAKAAALYFLSQENSSEGDSSSVDNSSSWTPKIYSNEEIITMQKDLDPAAYKVVAENGTERAFENEYWNNHEEGIYVDVVTGDPLFSSTHKYDSNTGWPSFYQFIDGAPVVEKPDTSHGMTRTEVRGQGGHLGHIFADGPKEHGGNRYCINSVALRFIPKDKMAAEGYQDYLYLFTQ